MKANKDAPHDAGSPRVITRALKPCVLGLVLLAGACGLGGPSDAEVTRLFFERLAVPLRHTQTEDGGWQRCVSSVIDSCVQRIDKSGGSDQVANLAARQNCSNRLYTPSGYAVGEDGRFFSKDELDAKQKCGVAYLDKLVAEMRVNSVVSVIDKEPIDNNYKVIVTIRQKGNDVTEKYRMILAKNGPAWEINGFSRES